MPERSDAAIPEIAAFVTVAQAGSFTRAAETLATSKSNVGKAVQRLEARLKTKLFQRTTRAVRLTEDGETYLAAARSALAGLREAEQALAARRAEPIGRVRLNLPAGFGRLLFPTLAELRLRYPRITFELALTDRMADAVGEGWDIVVRIGDLPQDSDLTVRKLCALRFGLYASPDYLARRGDVRTVADLSGHDAIIFRGSSGQLRPWTLLDGDTVRDILPEPSLIMSDGQVLVEAAMNGFGITQILDRVAHPQVTAGRLVNVLPEANLDGPLVHAIIPLGQRMTTRTRIVLNHLAESLKRPLE